MWKCKNNDCGWWRVEGGEGSGTSMWEFVVLLELLSMNFMENNKNGHQL
jgi:hypothetical protein